ncbi:glycosyltransferase family 4 protein [Ghiorsea bivora]|uniref:glycosyltransferase family 4 protein n=1 Tax=Ghiorsea bivora TaxID=1485545 RepID=UPI0006906D33|nr:MraY family glycosyltransferase [Ghiorsea bivora]
MAFEDLGLLFFTALILSLFLTPATITLAQKIGAMDSPVDRSVHDCIMPRMGGLGMAVAAIVSLSLFVALNQILIGFLLGVVIIVSTGVLDDLHGISPAKKMLGQILASIVFLELSGLSLNTLGNVLGFGTIDFPPSIAFLASLFCMVGLINAFNLSDGLDGLAAGITIIAAFFMGTFALESQNWLLLFVLVAFTGAIFGFLKFNTYPAKLFMGDTGSLTLGFFMASALMFLVGFEGAVSVPPISIAIILALPVSDTLLVMSRRILQGKSPVSADRTHLHHRLLAVGFSHSAVVTMIYLLAFFFGLLALVLHEYPEWLQLVIGLGVCVILYGVLSLCELWGCNVHKYSFAYKRQGERIDLATMMGKSIKGLRFAVLIGLLFPLPFVVAVPEATHNLLLGVFVLLLLAYPWKEHTQRLNIVYGLFYLTGITILFVWNISSYQGFSFSWYVVAFVVVLFIWSMFKIIFKGHNEVLMTSGLEIILLCVSWFVPFTILPVLGVSEEMMAAAKAACLQAVPLLIAMKIVIRKHPDRNHLLLVGLLVILLLMLVVL